MGMTMSGQTCPRRQHPLMFCRRHIIKPRHWHGVELDDHRDLILVQSTPQDALSESGSEQIVPLIMLPHGEEARLYSVFTAENIGKDRIKVKQHPYMLAFALTDFKLQGRTLNKLVISIPRGAVGKGQLQ